MCQWQHVQDARRPALSLAPQIDLETALQWTLQYNPTLLATRQNLNVSAEAINVARHFPTSLNPTVSIQCEPWVFQRQPNGQVDHAGPSGRISLGASRSSSGHRQAYREQMAQAQYTQTTWSVLQTELTAMVQTYRLHQTALYRREKLGIALELKDFNGRLVEIIRRQEEANQATAADVVLAEVESQTTVEQLEAARQDYVSALADLRQQIGIPGVAATAEPTGVFRVPEDQLRRRRGTGAVGPAEPAGSAIRRRRRGTIPGPPCNWPAPTAFQFPRSARPMSATKPARCSTAST